MKNFTKQFKPLNLPIHGVRLPSFFIEKDHKRKNGLSEDVDNFDFLRGICLNGFKKLKLKKSSKRYKEYADRAKHELDILKELGFIDYILLVWEVINYCKENKIPIGLGRGSAAGSLVLYLSGITAVDPIKNGLYFERFISKTRAKKNIVDGITYLDGNLMCDVDLDICYYNRAKVIKFLEEKFKGRTSKILTFLINSLSIFLTKLIISPELYFSSITKAKSLTTF